MSLSPSSPAREGSDPISSSTSTSGSPSSAGPLPTLKALSLVASLVPFPGRFPTELHEAVLSSCDQATLAVSSRVSFEFLELAGPLIYRHVAVVGRNQLFRLACKAPGATLLDRLRPYLSRDLISSLDLDLREGSDFYDVDSDADDDEATDEGNESWAWTGSCLDDYGSSPPSKLVDGFPNVTDLIIQCQSWPGWNTSKSYVESFEVFQEAEGFDPIRATIIATTPFRMARLDDTESVEWTRLAALTLVNIVEHNLSWYPQGDLLRHCVRCNAPVSSPLVKVTYDVRSSWKEPHRPSKDEGIKAVAQAMMAPFAVDYTPAEVANCNILFVVTVETLAHAEEVWSHIETASLKRQYHVQCYERISSELVDEDRKVRFNHPPGTVGAAHRFDLEEVE